MSIARKSAGVSIALVVLVWLLSPVPRRQTPQRHQKQPRKLSKRKVQRRRLRQSLRNRGGILQISIAPICTSVLNRRHNTVEKWLLLVEPVP